MYVYLLNKIMDGLDDQAKQFRVCANASIFYETRHLWHNSMIICAKKSEKQQNLLFAGRTVCRSNQFD